MNCKQGTAIIIEQMIELLDKLDEKIYSKPVALFNGSSIGQHFRHILDFYVCLFKGVNDGRVDYGNRQRDVLMETSPRYAQEILNEIIEKTVQLSEAQALTILADFSSDFNENRPFVHSTIGRELMYAYDHAVHHLAMIKMGLKTVIPEFEIDRNIGVAPSTIKHWKTVGKEN